MNDRSSMYTNDDRRIVALFSAILSQDQNSVVNLIAQIVENEGAHHLDYENIYGETCLHLAAKYGFDDALISLLDAGANPAVKDSCDYTPLHLSLTFLNIRSSAILLLYGADLGDKADAESRNANIDTLSVSKRRSLHSKYFSPIDLLSSLLGKYLIRAATSGFGGEVFSYGKADYQLGFEPPNAADVQYPRRVDALKHLNIVKVAASRHSSMAISRNGELFSWGHGKGGRLGHGNTVVQILPKLVEGLSTKIVMDVSTAENHTVAITSDGAVYTWGSNRFHQLGHSTTNRNDTSTCMIPHRVDALRKSIVIAAAAGTCHTAVVTCNGEVYTWGGNKSFQLGYLGPVSHFIGIPKLVRLVGPGVVGVGGSGRKAFAISAAAHSTVVISEGLSASVSTGITINEVYQWGHGNPLPVRVSFGQSRKELSGLGSSTDWVLPRQSTTQIVQVSAAKNHNVALSTTGQVFTWGFGADNLGLGKTPPESRSCSPQLVTAMLPEFCGGGIPTYISATDNRTNVVTNRGDLFSWGSADDSATLGGGKWQPVAQRVCGVKRAVMVATAVDHTIILLAASVPKLPHSGDSIGVQLPLHPSSLNLAFMRAFMPAALAKHCPGSSSIEEGSLSTSRNSGDEESSSKEEDQDDEYGDIYSSDDELYAGGYLPDESSNEIFHCGPKQARQDTFLNPLKLKQICEITLAKGIDLKSAPFILQYAHALEAPELMKFCAEYIRRNLDAVLLLGGVNAWQAIVDAEGAWPRTLEQQQQLLDLLLEPPNKSGRAELKSVKIRGNSFDLTKKKSTVYNSNYESLDSIEEQIKDSSVTSHVPQLSITSKGSKESISHHNPAIHPHRGEIERSSARSSRSNPDEKTGNYGLKVHTDNQEEMPPQHLIDGAKSFRDIQSEQQVQRVNQLHNDSHSPINFEILKRLTKKSRPKSSESSQKSLALSELIERQGLENPPSQPICNPWVTVPPVQSETNQIHSKNSFAVILAEEEQARSAGSALSGNDNKWFVERKPRSSSMERIQEEQHQEALRIAQLAREAEILRQEDEDMTLAIRLSLATMNKTRESRHKKRYKKKQQSECKPKEISQLCKDHKPGQVNAQRRQKNVKQMRKSTEVANDAVENS